MLLYNRENYSISVRAVTFFFMFLFMCTGQAGFTDNMYNNNTGKSGFSLRPNDIIWKQTNGPEGGNFRQLEVNPNNTQEILTGGPTGLYKSINGGTSWEKNLDTGYVTDIHFCSKPSGLVYLTASGTHIYRSANGGADWELISSQDTMQSAGHITVAPDNQSAVYVASNGPARIYKSSNGGDSFREIARFPEEHISAFAVVNEGTLLIGAGGNLSGEKGRFLSSFNDGKTWKTLNLGQAKASFVSSILVNPDNPQKIYAGFADSYNRSIREVNGNFSFTSENGGKTWKPLFDPQYGVNNPAAPKTAFQFSSIYALEVAKNNPEILYAVKNGFGVFKSTDSGRSWRQENSGLGSTSMTSVKVKNGQIYAGTQGSGVYAGKLQRNGSIRWLSEKSNKPKAKVSTIQIDVDPENPQKIFASAYPGGMLRSDDGGETWHDKNFLTPSIQVEDPAIQGYYSYDINPKNSNIIWMGVYGKGMFVSYDGMDYNMKADGRNGTMRGKHITKVLINPNNTQEIWVSSEEGVFRTTDNGAHWKPVNNGLHTKDVYVMSIANNGTLYAGTRGYGVYRFNREQTRWNQLRSIGNFGIHWSTWERPLYQYSDMLIDPENPNNWYIASFPTELYKSTDAGKTWKESNIGFIKDGTDGIFSITFHPHDTSTIFAGTYNGVSISRDRGEHWKRISNGMDPEQWPYSIAIDPSNTDIMYAATKNGKDKGFHDRHEPPYNFSGKVYKTTDGGEHWFEIMDGLQEDNEFFNIIIHPKNPDILFVNMSFDGVAMSTNKGKTWHLVNNGLENTRAGNSNNVSNSMVLGKNGRYFYFGSMGSGVWRARLY